MPKSPGLKWRWKRRLGGGGCWLRPSNVQTMRQETMRRKVRCLQGLRVRAQTVVGLTKPWEASAGWKFARANPPLRQINLRVMWKIGKSWRRDRVMNQGGKASSRRRWRVSSVWNSSLRLYPSHSHLILVCSAVQLTPSLVN